MAHAKLTESGFRHYETSNYASTDQHLSKHNWSYWEGRSYLGLGPSAVSTLHSPQSETVALRWKNTPDTNRYIQQINTTGHAMSDIERLTKEQYHLERIALLLRTDTDLPLIYLPKESDFSVLLENQLAACSDTHLTLTEKGALLVDPIAAELAG